MKLSKILKNKVIFYLFSRYGTYGLQFLCSLLIASKLGPYYMGIWGFLLLILSYFEQIHFGISNSLNVLYVHNKDNAVERDRYTLNSMFLIGVLCLGVVIIYAMFLFRNNSTIGKYDIGEYAFLICVIAIFQYIQQFLTNLYRVKNKLWIVALVQSIITILTFISVLIFAREKLLYALLLSYLVGYLFSIILVPFTKVLPVIFLKDFQIKYQKVILKKGFYLFIYNTCIMFMIITVRSIISKYYNIEEFGLFTFSYSLAHAFLLLLQSISFVVFPKVIWKLAEDDKRKVKSMIDQYRSCYITSSHVLIYSSLILFPLVTFFLESYRDGLKAMEFVALSFLIQVCSVGYTELLISKNKEKILAIFSAGTLLLNFLLAICLACLVNVSFDKIIFSTMVSYLLYAFLVSIYAHKLLDNTSIKDTLCSVLPFKIVIPFIVALLVCISNKMVLLPIPLIVFIFLNLKDLMNILKMVSTLINKPQIVDL